MLSAIDDEDDDWGRPQTPLLEAIPIATTMRPPTPEPQVNTPPRKVEPSRDPGLLVLGFGGGENVVQGCVGPSTPEPESVPESRTSSRASSPEERSCPQRLANCSPPPCSPRASRVSIVNLLSEHVEDRPAVQEDMTRDTDGDVHMVDPWRHTGKPDNYLPTPEQAVTPASPVGRTESSNSEPGAELPTPPSSGIGSSASPQEHSILQHSQDSGLRSNERWVCEFPGCTKTFRTKYLLKSHGDSHSNVNKYYCLMPKCGRGFKRKNELVRHESTHGKIGFPCPHCPDSTHQYPRKDNLKRHIQKAHPQVPVPIGRNFRNGGAPANPAPG
ncbi:hypothetical protein AC578_9397 [Pseudocercospora eumusae]|uniref:C2H2-type domain-containing protein n=1 Tax=Pseudocercospora eumusae TaxID=321146 RepID=A0A139H6T2_9PEZI|nr:hypothetical protein AC578_9397 [Pseudocercospora eumusae]